MSTLDINIGGSMLFLKPYVYILMVFVLLVTFIVFVSLGLQVHLNNIKGCMCICNPAEQVLNVNNNKQ